MLGLLFTGAYILKGIRAVLHGPFNMHWKDYNLEIDRAGGRRHFATAGLDIDYRTAAKLDIADYQRLGDEAARRLSRWTS